MCRPAVIPTSEPAGPAPGWDRKLGVVDAAPFAPLPFAARVSEVLVLVSTPDRCALVRAPGGTRCLDTLRASKTALRSALCARASLSSASRNGLQDRRHGARRTIRALNVILGTNLPMTPMSSSRRTSPGCTGLMPFFAFISQSLSDSPRRRRVGAPLPRERGRTCISSRGVRRVGGARRRPRWRRLPWWTDWRVRARRQAS